MNHLYFDFETYSSVDIKKCGAYKYTQSPDFEILMLAYSINNGPVKVYDNIDFNNKNLNEFFVRIFDSKTIKHAHNAMFERLCLSAYGIDIPAEEFECSAVKALYCGLPASLDGVTKALELNDEYLKDANGKALIKYFCTPCKPSKANGYRIRNLPEHDAEKWKLFMQYCRQDVISEKAVIQRLASHTLPNVEKENYVIDQIINDRGVKIDLDLAQNAINIDSIITSKIHANIIKTTGIDNPNSGAQFKKWLTDMTGENVTTLTKESYPDLLKLTDDPIVIKTIGMYMKGSKTSTAKYAAAVNSVGFDGRIRGILQFYGANRTGRYAGRIVQIHNLPRNKMKELDLARNLVIENDYSTLDIVFDNTKQVLSELIRTMFVPKDNHVFGILDFSAIEARVLAWLAGEKWRLDVFNTHGKIYEASAAMMFGIPLESVTKESEYRTKGKIAELALGYQGAVGAMERMGGEAMGLSHSEMKTIVTKWRKKNTKIVETWEDYQICAIRSIQYKDKTFRCKRRLVEFLYEDNFMTIKLPSGRKLYYYDPKIAVDRFGHKLTFMGFDDKNRWTRIDTYGGKLTENITQAVARDLLAFAIKNIENSGYPVCMHIHDEVVTELPKLSCVNQFNDMIDIMSTSPDWAKDLTLRVDGFMCDYYKKD